MKTIRLVIDLTYNDEAMYGKPETNTHYVEDLAWFNSDVLGSKLELYSFELGDMVGSVVLVQKITEGGNEIDYSSRPCIYFNV